jgi:hypothetical protein
MAFETAAYSDALFAKRIDIINYVALVKLDTKTRVPIVK